MRFLNMVNGSVWTLQKWMILVSVGGFKAHDHIGVEKTHIIISLVPGALTFCGGAWRARERNAWERMDDIKLPRVPLARAPCTAAELQSAGDEVALSLYNTHYTVRYS